MESVPLIIIYILSSTYEKLKLNCLYISKTITVMDVMSKIFLTVFSLGNFMYRHIRKVMRAISINVKIRYMP